MIGPLTRELIERSRAHGFVWLTIIRAGPPGVTGWTVMRRARKKRPGWFWPNGRVVTLDEAIDLLPAPTGSAPAAGSKGVQP